MEYIFDNGLKLIYKKSNSKLTSICIGLEAGASVEDNVYGLAHACEHMVYKGTKNRSEKQINEELSEIFAFNNAMTNYPYVIYYGTLLEEDLYKGIEIFADILLEPSFSKDGFEEEMDVIKQELNEWDEDLEQYCEDRLFYNAFSNRLKYPIIGRKTDLDKITLDDIKRFYKMYYLPNNTSIAVVTALDFKEVVSLTQNYFGKWEKKELKIIEKRVEKIREKVYYDYKVGVNSSRVEFIFSMQDINFNEMRAFKIFNEFFGEGVNSILFDTLRTKMGLVYDVLTYICYEKYIKLYKIVFNTSKEKVDEAINAIKEALLNIEDYKVQLNKSKRKELIKSIKLKKLFNEEKSIFLAKELAEYDVMFKDSKEYESFLKGMENITEEEIVGVARKVFQSTTIEIINSKEG